MCSASVCVLQRRHDRDQGPRGYVSPTLNLPASDTHIQARIYYCSWKWRQCVATSTPLIYTANVPWVVGSYPGSHRFLQGGESGMGVALAVCFQYCMGSRTVSHSLNSVRSYGNFFCILHADGRPIYALEIPSIFPAFNGAAFHHSIMSSSRFYSPLQKSRICHSFEV